MKYLLTWNKLEFQFLQNLWRLPIRNIQKYLKVYLNDSESSSTYFLRIFKYEGEVDLGMFYLGVCHLSSLICLIDAPKNETPF